MRLLWDWTSASESLKICTMENLGQRIIFTFLLFMVYLTMLPVSYTTQLRMVGLLMIVSEEYWRKLFWPNRIYYPDTRRRKDWSKVWKNSSEDLTSQLSFVLDTADYEVQSLPLWPNYTKEYYRIKVNEISLLKVLMPHTCIASGSEI